MAKEMIKVEIDDLGGSPIAEHNMPCAVCHERKAVYNLSANVPKSGVFDPCWRCQEKGWFISKKQPADPIGSLLRKWFI